MPCHVGSYNETPGLVRRQRSKGKHDQRLYVFFEGRNRQGRVGMLSKLRLGSCGLLGWFLVVKYLALG